MPSGLQWDFIESAIPLQSSGLHGIAPGLQVIGWCCSDRQGLLAICGHTRILDQSFDHLAIRCGFAILSQSNYRIAFASGLL